MKLSRFIKYLCVSAVILSGNVSVAQPYVPTDEVKESQRQFNNDRFGIFIHWGIYSMFGQGEWYLNKEDVVHDEYVKAAACFYPVNFDAKQWSSAIKDSGARYVTITSRHHDGFSMFHTAQSPYNIVDATPFKRDVLKEFANACQDDSLHLHFYYSHLDWGRPDYPKGRTGKGTITDTTSVDWPAYYDFMNRQLTELLTGYGPVRAIWFDGWWDHDSDSIPFDWQLGPQYELIHRLQPSCMVANNHHQTPYEGEDIQIFERDLPGENTAGLSGQSISRLPLETCNTMSDGWGYWVRDVNHYKSSAELIRYLVRAAGMGANLLLNIGPLPDGTLPEKALERLHDIGQWMRVNGETIYGTESGGIESLPAYTSTRKDNRYFIHVIGDDVETIDFEFPCKITDVSHFESGKKLNLVKKGEKSYSIAINRDGTDPVDYIIQLTTK